MRMRLGAPLLAGLVGLLGAVRPAAAGDCGAAKYTGCPDAFPSIEVLTRSRSDATFAIGSARKG